MQAARMYFGLVCLILIAASYQFDTMHAMEEDVPVDRSRRSGHPASLLEMTFHPMNLTEVDPGDPLTYVALVSHRSSSVIDASQIEITWLIPVFLKFVSIAANDTGLTNTLVKNNLKLTIPSLSVDNVIRLQMGVAVDPNATLWRGHHYVVHTLCVTWLSSLSDGENETQPITTFLPSFTFTNEIVVAGCSSPLGMGDGRIASHQLWATSSYASLRPDQAREGLDAWCSLSTREPQILEVSFDKPVTITKIALWRRFKKGSWVKTFKLEHFYQNWHYYGINGEATALKGNTASFEPASNWLLYPMKAKKIRIHPIEYQGSICMRFELYGCTYENQDQCIGPLGMESGAIPDAAISKTPSAHDLLPGSYARLNFPVMDFPFGYELSLPGEYLQIDLGSSHRITKIAIQGSDGEASDFFVQSYRLAYSNTSLDGGWLTVGEDGSPKLLNGPTDFEEAKYPTFAKVPGIVIARYLRITPESYEGAIILRLEIYGCLSEPYPKELPEDVPEFGRRTVLYEDQHRKFHVCVYTNPRTGVSCRYTENGFDWIEMPRQIINVIAYDCERHVLVAIDQSISYVLSKDYGISWTSISYQRWLTFKMAASVTLATALDDIMVGGEPNSANVWPSQFGTMWGVSGDGVHLKTNVTTQWKLIGTWKCCGN